VADETRNLAMIATIASWLIIAVYLWFRFKSLVYGLAAIIAVIHDVLITLGAVAVTYWLSMIPGLSQILLIEPFKIDLPMIAAFLTLIGFSVNDTIVIFDRIRELKGKSSVLTGQMINDALNQTLSRTILTSFTAWLVVLILYVAGGEGLHGFAFALVVGFLSGTYSTIYIATPILIDWDKKAVETPAKGKELIGSR
jgi:SecD/SecF fusion protein